jgi:hypothetical protein
MLLMLPPQLLLSAVRTLPLLTSLPAAEGEAFDPCRTCHAAASKQKPQKFA